MYAASVRINQHYSEAVSMCTFFRKIEKQSKANSRHRVQAKFVVLTIIIDYAQNMEMPSLRKDQPGETFYFSPMNVPAFGIVDCSTDDNILHAYIYSEAEGKKGGSDVASLIMKFLDEEGYLDGETRLKLNIVCDNCTGKNSNF